MAPTRKSNIWKFYENNSDGSATCRLCTKRIKASGNTSNLFGHIKSRHPKSLESLALGRSDTKAYSPFPSTSSSSLSVQVEDEGVETEKKGGSPKNTFHQSTPN
ncbi:uncharacterized protein CBL_12819 [Carabus blaptoides fortunei]